MGEKRKPDVVLLPKKQGKSNKVEMFCKRQWQPDNYMGKQYRLRVNGKWFPKDKVVYFNKTEVKELFFKNI